MCRRWKEDEWQAKTKLYKKGKVVVGPDRTQFYVSLTLYVIGIIPFFSLIMPHLVSRTNIAYLIVGIYLALSTIITMLLTSHSDPGVIPRNQRAPPGRSKVKKSKRPKNININGVTHKIKFCSTCKIWRPPRSSHCSICDACVSHFDHHCPWVGQCIGLRNYKLFLSFVFSATLTSAYGVFCSIYGIILAFDENSLTDDQFLSTLKDVPINFIFTLYAFAAAISIGALLSFHIYLFSTNQKTYEKIKKVFSENGNHFDQGCFKNISFWVFGSYFTSFTTESIDDLVSNQRIPLTEEEKEKIKIFRKKNKKIENSSKDDSSSLSNDQKPKKK